MRRADPTHLLAFFPFYAISSLPFALLRTRRGLFSFLHRSLGYDTFGYIALRRYIIHNIQHNPPL